MIYDRFMEEAIREVDALTPSVPPMLPEFIRVAYPRWTVGYDQTTRTFVMEPGFGGRTMSEARYALDYPHHYDLWRFGRQK